MWCGSSAISSVGRSAQRRRWTSGPAATRRVGDGDAVAVARLGPGAVGPVGLELDAVAGGVERPLAADVRRRRDDARRAPRAPRRASGGRRAARTWSCRRRASRSQEGVAFMVEDRGGGGLLPGAQRPGGGPGGQGATRRGPRRSVDLVRQGTEQLRRRVGRSAASATRRFRSHTVVVRSMIVSLHVTHFSDPGCPWAWSASPAIAALKWRYGDQLDWRDVMIGLTENGSVYEARGYTRRRPGARLSARSASAACRSRPSRASSVHGTWPMCRVVVATRRLAPEREYAVFRALQFAQFTSTLDLEDPKDLLEAIAWVPGHRRRRDHRRRRAIPRPRRCSSRTATWPARPRAARPSSRTSTPTPTAASATRRRASRSRTQQGVTLEAGGFQTLRGLRRADRQPRPDARAAAPPAEDAAEVLEAFPDGLTTAEVAQIMAQDKFAAGPQQGRGRADRRRSATAPPQRLPFGHDALWVPERARRARPGGVETAPAGRRKAAPPATASLRRRRRQRERQRLA